MADNKLYITQAQENGNVMISEDVIATVVAHAIAEVEGVVGLSVKPGSDIKEKFRKTKKSKSIKVLVSEENELTIECNINVYYDQSVVTVAKAVQEAVSAAVLSTTNVQVVAVNVNVCGIVRQ